MIYGWLKNKIPHGCYVKKRVNGDMLIVCAKDLSMYYFNKTAAFFMKEVDGEKSIDDIKKMFMENFEVNESELETDMVNMIRDLQWKKIIYLEE